MNRLQLPLLFAGLLLLLTGMIDSRIWTSVTPATVILMVLWAGCLLGGIWLNRHTLRLHSLLALGLITLLALTHFCGLGTVIATLLLMFTASALGSLLLARDAPDLLTSLAAGMGLVAGMSAWLLPFPVFSTASLLIVCTAVILWRRQSLLEQLRSAQVALTEVSAAAPAPTLWLGIVLALATMPVWLPTLMADDLAYHLQLPLQLARDGYYRFDVGSQVWSLAPMHGDVLHALVRVLGGGESIGPLNLFWLTCTGVAVFRLGAGMGLNTPLACLGAMLYLSLPLSGGLAQGMQTEIPSAAVAATLAVLVQSSGDRPDLRRLLLLLTLAGFLLGLKVLNIVLIAPLALWQLWRWRQHLPWRHLPVAAITFGIVGGASYIYAWLLAGNPILPLYNGLFASPWYPVTNFHDATWSQGMHWDLPWQLSFNTPAYFEGRTGAAGLALIALAGGAVTGLANPRSRPLLLVGLVAWLIPLGLIQYLRYAHPAMALLLPALLAGLADTARLRPLMVAAASLVVMQLCLQSTSSWILWGKSVRDLIRDGQDIVIRRISPELAIAQRTPALLDEHERILIASPDVAYRGPFGERAFVANWYDYQHQNLKFSSTDGRGWAAVVASTGATHLLQRTDETDPSLHAFLATDNPTEILQIGNVRLLRLGQNYAQTVTGHVAQSDRSQIVEFLWQGDAQRFADARVALRCAVPGANLVISWVAAGRTEDAYYAWIPCGADGTATSRMRLNLPLGVNSLNFTARPLDDQEAVLQVQENSVLLRPDLSSQRDLGAKVRAMLCPRLLCPDERVNMVPASP